MSPVEKTNAPCIWESVRKTQLQFAHQGAHNERVVVRYFLTESYYLHTVCMVKLKGHNRPKLPS